MKSHSALFPAESITDPQIFCVGSLMDWVFSALQLKPSLKPPIAMQSIVYSAVTHTTTRTQ